MRGRRRDGGKEEGRKVDVRIAVDVVCGGI